MHRNKKEKLSTIFTIILLIIVIAIIILGRIGRQNRIRIFKNMNKIEFLNNKSITHS